MTDDTTCGPVTRPGPAGHPVAERRLRAMGSDAHLVVVGGPPGVIDAAARRVDELEHRWSRFLPDSEVSALNRADGRSLAVSPDTVLLVSTAVEAWRLSGGAFDPTVLGAVIRAGYDRSYELLGPTPPAGLSALGVGADQIEVDGRAVRLPAGVGFDPGGIGKGLAADVVSAWVIEQGVAGVSVNLGGDLRVRGTGPGGGPWTIAVEHPWQEEPVALLGLSDGAVATSTTLRRRWSVGGRPAHHLVDPRTGLPSDTDVALATVVSGQAWTAEVLAKAVLLAGAAHPFDIVGGTGAEALAVDDDGRVAATPGLLGFLGGRDLPVRLRRPAGG